MWSYPRKKTGEFVICVHTSSAHFYSLTPLLDVESYTRVENEASVYCVLKGVRKALYVLLPLMSINLRRSMVKRPVSMYNFRIQEISFKCIAMDTIIFH